MNASDVILPPCGQAALDFAARGFHVFPVPLGAKKSHKSAEHSDGRAWGATTDPAEIARDWRRWPLANLGLVTGSKSGFFVVEADTTEGHGVDGIGNLAALIEEHGGWEDTVEALSPSGSWHIWFRWPEAGGIFNSEGAIAGGIDVRGDGGMVLAPPSRKPGVETAYRWKNPPGRFALADCPPWLLGLCRKAGRQERSAGTSRSGPRIDTGQATAWAQKALHAEILGVLSAPHGARNATLNKAAFNLGQIVGGGSLDEVETRARLISAGLFVGLEVDETHATVASGMTAGMAEPRWPPEGRSQRNADDADEASESQRARSQGASDDQDNRPSWLDGCILDGRSKKPIPNLANVMLALRGDPALLDVVAFDEMATMTMLAREMPQAGEPGEPIALRPMTDQDAGALQEYLQHVGLARVSRETVFQGLEMRAHERAFHLVRGYLNGLAWDGQPRLDTWLTSYLGVEATTYTSAVGAMFLIAMVARVMRPGCKVDHLLVLEGPQGARKSTACAILGGTWFSDALPDIREGKEAAAHLAGKWLIEVGEMHALGRAEATLLKSFITRAVERYRPAYGRMEVIQPRQCVFVATTNETVYLRDATGGWRFWPVKVGTIDVDALARDRDQLFAEAVAAFCAGRPWWPDATLEREQIAPQQEQRFETDAWEQAIVEFFKGHQQATVGEIAQGALGFETARIGTADQRRIVSVLEHLGMERLPQHWSGKRYWRRP